MKIIANRLKNLKITSTDLVTQGANPDAHICLFKSKDGESSEPETLLQKVIAAITGAFGKTAPVQKEAETFSDELRERMLREVCNQVWDFCYALDSSFCSIIYDDELSEEEKRTMLLTSLDQFAEVMRNAIPSWAAGNKKENAESAVQKSAAQTAAFEELILKYAKSTAEPAQAQSGETTPQSNETEPNNIGGENNPIQKTETEEIDTMKIDRSKMTPEELAALEAIEKKYGTAEPDATPAAASGADTPPADDGVAKGAAPELHPDVKKALETNAILVTQIEALQKSLELKDLTAIAKKYEIVGKKAEELAPKLYDLKKAGGTAYDDFIGLLDESVTLVEKSGTFGEIGSARTGPIGTGDELGARAAEVKKTNADMTNPQAIIKAFEENPELAAKYEQEYFNMNRRAN